jgi:hypothetical protein
MNQNACSRHISSLVFNCICILSAVFLFQTAKDAANRWLCNIQCTMSFCEKRFSIDQKTIHEHFGIDPEMEFL